MTTVRAALLTGPSRIAVVDAPAPAPERLADGQVLLRVLAGGICGSDLPAFRGTGPVTGTIGLVEVLGAPLHEVVGEVVASRHPEVRPGRRVVGWASEFDGLADLVVTAGAGLREYDPALDPTVAVLLQPLACVLDALELVRDVRGARVAVLGLGPIGLLFAHVLRARGAAHVTGVDLVDRADLAARYGVDEVVRAGAELWAAGRSRDRPDVVVEAVGHQVGTLRAAVEAVADRGQIHYFGVPDDPVYPLPMALFLRKCLTLSSGYTTARHAALDMASKYLAEHPDLAEHYVTDVFALADVQRAFDVAARPAPGRVKVVLDLSR